MMTGIWKKKLMKSIEAKYLLFCIVLRAFSPSISMFFGVVIFVWLLPFRVNRVDLSDSEGSTGGSGWHWFTSSGGTGFTTPFYSACSWICRNFSCWPDWYTVIG